MSFNGKVVLITGASSGIGAETARHLSKLGAQVSIVDRNQQRLDEVYDQIKKISSNEPLKIVADVTKDTERIVDATIKRFGKLDVLINSAGICSQDTVDTMDLSEFDKMFDINVRSIIKLTKLCAPYLEKTKGNIVNLSSVCGIRARGNMITYCMSKAAVDQFTKCAALDLAPKGIRINSINPAVIQTNIFESMGLNEKEVNGLIDGERNQYPLGRIGEVSDMSTAIAYLADSNSASFLTGVILPVDGGSVVA